MLDLIGRLNAHHLEPRADDAELVGPDPGVRAGLPDAERGPRGGRPVAASRPRRRRSTASTTAHGRVRHPLPAGPAAGRARRPVRAALLRRRQRLGRPRRRRDEPRRRCARETDKPVAGLLDRPEAARAARQHAGHLGRRVRPDADVRERQGPRPQPARLLRAGWPAAASRAARSTARPTPSASAPRSTASTSTTCTPRSCTCSASTTPS